jgi:type IX secretion system PorP/SprF family membrane protein
MRKIIIGISFCLVTAVGFAQQLFQQTQFMVNPYTLNPALAGSEDFVDIKAGYRNQWLGFQDSYGYSSDAIAPRTMYLSAHSSLGHDHSYYRDPKHEHKAFHGIGGFVVSDKLGEYSSTSAYGSYSYNMLLLKSNKTTGQMYGFNGQDRHIGVRMIIGAHLGMYQHTVNVGELIDYLEMTKTGEDPYLAQAFSNANKWGPDGSLGVWIYSNNYYVGASIRRIFSNDIKLEPYPQFNLSRFYNVMAGYKLMMSDFLLFEPSTNIKFEGGAKPSVDLNAMVVYDNTYTNSRGAASHKNKDLHLYTGVTYRAGAAVALLIGGVIERKYEIAYSFDITTNYINPYQSGSHEVTIGYRILPKKRLTIAEQIGRHAGTKKSKR